MPGIGKRQTLRTQVSEVKVSGQGRGGIVPTEAQKDRVIYLCQQLSTLYQPIWVFRYDSTYQYVYILAGREEGLDIIIYPDGQWRFITNDTTEF